jgi:hypothetical protein
MAVARLQVSVEIYMCMILRIFFPPMISTGTGISHKKVSEQLNQGVENPRADIF